MEIKKSDDGTVMTVGLSGEVYSMNIAEIEAVLLKDLEGVNDVTFDLAGLEYISSAGLRLLLQVHKMMRKNGKMVIKNVSDDIMDLLKTTGFVKWLNIER